MLRLSPKSCLAPRLALWLALLSSPLLAGERWTVRGRVLAPDGEPIAGARVACDAGNGFDFPRLTAPIGWRLLADREETHPGLLAFAEHAVSTDAEGRFQIDDLAEPTFGVVGIEAEGHPFLEHVIVSAEADLATRTIDLGDVSLQRGHHLRGRVRGEGAAGAVVALQPLREPLVPGEPPPARRPGELRVVVADAEGKFEMKGVRTGQHIIAAFGPTSQVATRSISLEAGGEDLDGIELALVPGLALPCQVVSLTDRSPVPGVQLTLWPASTSSTGTVFALDIVRTDDAGRATFQGLTTGEYRVIAIPGDQLSSSGPVPPYSLVATARAGAELELVMSLGRDLVLSVEDPEGQPIEPVQLARLDPVRNAYQQPGYEERHGVPGSFVFEPDAELWVAERVRPGVYRLTLYARGYQPAVLELELNDAYQVPRHHVLDESGHDFSAHLDDGQPHLVLRLPPALGLMNGRVVDGVGQPIEGAHIRGTELHRELKINAVQHAETDAEGRFQLDGLFGQNAHVRVDVEAEGYLLTHADWTLLRDGTPPAIVLAPAGRLTGVLTNSDDRPIPWGQVQLIDGDPEPYRGPELARQVTDEKGRFAFEGLRAGPYRLEADRARVEVELASGQHREVVLKRR